MTGAQWSSSAKQYEKYINVKSSSVSKESACNAGDPGLIPGLRRSGEGRGSPLQYSWSSLVVQLAENPPAMQETWIWSLGWEDPLEKGTDTHSSILPWRLYSPWNFKMLDMTEQFSLHFTSPSIKNKYQATINMSLALWWLVLGVFFCFLIISTTTLMEIALYRIHLQVRKYTEKVKSFNLKLLNSKVNGLLFCLTLFGLWFYVWWSFNSWYSRWC